MGQLALFNFGTFGTKSSEVRGSGVSADRGTESNLELGTVGTKLREGRGSGESAEN